MFTDNDVRTCSNIQWCLEQNQFFFNAILPTEIMTFSLSFEHRDFLGFFNGFGGRLWDIQFPHDPFHLRYLILESFNFSYIYLFLQNDEPLPISVIVIHLSSTTCPYRPRRKTQTSFSALTLQRGHNPSCEFWVCPKFFHSGTSRKPPEGAVCETSNGKTTSVDSFQCKKKGHPYSQEINAVIFFKTALSTTTVFWFSLS